VAAVAVVQFARTDVEDAVKDCHEHLRMIVPAEARVHFPQAPPAFPNRPSQGPRTGKLLRPQPYASCAACPDRSQPRHALLRAAAAGLDCVLGGRQRCAREQRPPAQAGQRRAVAAARENAF
jgi:hypothetical protein